MKWNCHIVKEMYDRVLRRKFGILCVDDTSNENFIQSYLNRLDCKVIDLKCAGNNLPCDNSISVIGCNIVIFISTNITDEGVIRYTFTATSTGDVPSNTYQWLYNELNHWNYISGQGTNVLVLEPQDQTGNLISTNVAVVLTDSNGCIGTKVINVKYKGGCTDPEAINYDSAATFNNGTCYNTPLSFTIDYGCQEDNTGLIIINIVGGVAPYTVVGTQNGDIIPNGGTYSAYVVDSVGNTTPIQGGTVTCPFDCNTVTINTNLNYACISDKLGNTGQANLLIAPTGGTAPYTITGTINGIPTTITDGMLLNDNDVVAVTVTDINGCFVNDNITIDCPAATLPIDISCDQINFSLNTNIRQQTQVAEKLGLRMHWALTGLTAGVGFVSIDFQISETGTYSSNFNCNPGLPPCNSTVFTTSGSDNLQYDFTLNPPACEGKTFSIKVTATITISTAAGNCIYEYEYTHTGDLKCPFVAGNIISTHTQTY